MEAVFDGGRADQLEVLLDLLVNRRDFPLLKTDGTEPYEAIHGAGRPLLFFFLLLLS